MPKGIRCASRLSRSSTRPRSMFPLNGWYVRGCSPSGNHQVDRLGALILQVGACGVEVRVVRDDVALLGSHAEQDALGRAALMRGNDVLVAREILQHRFETEEGPGAGVALVAFHDRAPLLGAHGAGPAVGQEVEQHAVGRNEKDVQLRFFEPGFPLVARAHADRLDGLDAERLDDGVDHGFLAIAPITGAVTFEPPGSDSMSACVSGSSRYAMGHLDASFGANTPAMIAIAPFVMVSFFGES